MIESPTRELASEKRMTESRDDETTAVGEYEDWTQWVLAYAGFHYEDPPNHEVLASIAPEVPDYLRVNAHRLPEEPDRSIVLTDFGSTNLLSPDGTVPADGLPDSLTGVLDLERAKLGPIAFTAVNAEYLMTRFMEKPAPLVEELYDPLPFGPDVPNRDLYRLVAMGRSVNALDLWYEEEGETFRQRGAELADQIAQIV